MDPKVSETTARKPWSPCDSSGPLPEPLSTVHVDHGAGYCVASHAGDDHQSDIFRASTMMRELPIGREADPSGAHDVHSDRRKLDCRRTREGFNRSVKRRPYAEADTGAAPATPGDERYGTIWSNASGKHAEHVVNAPESLEGLARVCERGFDDAAGLSVRGDRDDDVIDRTKGVECTQNAALGCGIYLNRRRTLRLKGWSRASLADYHSRPAGEGTLYDRGSHGSAASDDERRRSIEAKRKVHVFGNERATAFAFTLLTSGIAAAGTYCGNARASAASTRDCAVSLSPPVFRLPAEISEATSE